MARIKHFPSCFSCFTVLIYYYPTLAAKYVLHIQQIVIEHLPFLSAMKKQSAQLLSHVWLFTTPWTLAHQSSLSINNCRSPPKPMSIESVMSSNHLILCRLLFLLPSIFPSIRVFSMSQFFASDDRSVGVLASVLPMNIQDWFPSQLTGLITFLSKGLSRVFSNTTVQKHHFFSAQLSLWSNSHIHTWLMERQWEIRKNASTMEFTVLLNWQIAIYFKFERFLTSEI